MVHIFVFVSQSSLNLQLTILGLTKCINPQHQQKTSTSVTFFHQRCVNLYFLHFIFCSFIFSPHPHQWVSIFSLGHVHGLHSYWVLTYIYSFGCGSCERFISLSFSFLTDWELSDKQNSARTSFLSWTQRLSLALNTYHTHHDIHLHTIIYYYNK